MDDDDKNVDIFGRVKADIRAKVSARGSGNARVNTAMLLAVVAITGSATAVTFTMRGHPQEGSRGSEHTNETAAGKDASTQCDVMLVILAEVLRRQEAVATMQAQSQNAWEAGHQAGAKEGAGEVQRLGARVQQLQAGLNSCSAMKQKPEVKDAMGVIADAFTRNPELLEVALRALEFEEKRMHRDLSQPTPAIPGLNAKATLGLPKE